MKFANVALIRLFQFVIFVLFTFMILVYFGTMLLLPLSILTQLIRLLSAIGLPGIIAASGAIGALAYVGYQVYRMPVLSQTIVSTGVELVTFGYAKIMAFEKLLQTGGQSASTEESSQLT